jgi:hypothetical protein
MVTRQLYIIDVYQDETDQDTICIHGKLKENGATMVHKLTSCESIYAFHVTYWKTIDYQKAGCTRVVENGKNFFNAYDTPTSIYGEYYCTPSKWERYIKPKLPSRTICADPTFTLLDRMKCIHPELHVENYIEIDDNANIRSIGPWPVVWNIATIVLDIRNDSNRQSPVANWKISASKYKMDPMEVCDEQTHEIRKISLFLFDTRSECGEIDFSTHSEGNMIEFESNEYEEFEMLTRFAIWWKGAKNNIDLLLCWKYEESLEYIRDRCLFHNSEDIDEINQLFFNRATSQLSATITWKNEEPVHQTTIALDHLRYESIHGMLYCSLFHYHRILCPNKDIGYQWDIFVKHYAPENGETTLNVYDLSEIFFNLKLTQLLCDSAKMFLTDHRTIFGPFWKNLSRSLYAYVNSNQTRSNETPHYYFIHRWNSSKNEETYVGGLVLEADTKQIIENVGSFDVVSAYPNYIIERNMCFTTRLSKVFEVASNRKQSVPKHYSIATAKQKTKFVKTIDGASSPTSQRQEMETSSSSSDAVCFVDESIQIGIVPQFVLKYVLLRNSIQKDPTRTSMSKMIKFFINRIYGMFNSGTIFQCIDIAKAITSMSHEALGYLRTSICERDNVHIVAGDTDGIMAHFPKVENTISISNEICERFVQLSNYRYIRVRCDTIFKAIYFINRKNYFALKSSDVLVEKGTEGIRKDRPRLLKEIIKYIEAQILSITFLESNVNRDDYEATVQCHVVEMIAKGRSDPSLLKEDNYTFGKFKFVCKPTLILSTTDITTKLKNEIVPKVNEMYAIFKKILYQGCD